MEAQKALQDKAESLEGQLTIIQSELITTRGYVNIIMTRIAYFWPRPMPH